MREEIFDLLEKAGMISLDEVADYALELDVWTRERTKIMEIRREFKEEKFRGSDIEDEVAKRKDKRLEVKREVSEKIDEVYEALKKLKSLDYELRDLSSVKIAQRKDEAIRNMPEEGMNQWFEPEDPPARMSLFDKVEKIYNKTYTMYIGYNKFTSNYYSNKFEVEYLIKANDFLDWEELKNVERDFRFYDDEEEEVKSEMLDYIDGRKRHWGKKLFDDIKPPLPQIGLDEVAGIRVGGFEIDEDLKI